MYRVQFATLFYASLRCKIAIGLAPAVCSSYNSYGTKCDVMYIPGRSYQLQKVAGLPWELSKVKLKFPDSWPQRGPEERTPISEKNYIIGTVIRLFCLVM